MKWWGTTLERLGFRKVTKETYTRVYLIRGEDPPGYMRVVLADFHSDGAPVFDSTREVNLKFPSRMRPTINRVLLGTDTDDDKVLFENFVLGHKDSQ